MFATYEYNICFYIIQYFDEPYFNFQIYTTPPPPFIPVILHIKSEILYNRTRYNIHTAIKFQHFGKVLNYLYIIHELMFDMEVLCTSSNIHIFVIIHVVKFSIISKGLLINIKT